MEKARQELGRLRRQHQADLVIVNGENAAERNGITEQQFRDLRFAGADVVTMGNHTWANSEIYHFIDREEALIRPFNYPAGTPGRGYTIVDLGRTRVAVINLLGNVFVSTLPSPFTMIDDLLQDLQQQGIRHIIIDFHGEATSEKIAFAHYVDGRASAVLGTHTHVQTAMNAFTKGYSLHQRCGDDRGGGFGAGCQNQFVGAAICNPDTGAV